MFCNLCLVNFSLCVFFCFVFVFSSPCSSPCSASLDVFIVAHGWAETDTPLLLSLLTYLDYACLCVLFWGTACPSNGRLLRVTLCLNMFVLLCWGRRGLQARVSQKYYGLNFEMGEVSLKSQHIAMSEWVFIRMTSGAVSRARLRSSFFYPPSPRCKAAVESWQVCCIWLALWGLCHDWACLIIVAILCA